MDGLCSLIILIVVQQMSAEIVDNYINSIKQQTELQKKTFLNTLDLLPNGVILLDFKTKEIIFKNKKMELMLGSLGGGGGSNNSLHPSSTLDILMKYIMVQEIHEEEFENAQNEFFSSIKDENQIRHTQSSREGDGSKNLWEYLSQIQDHRDQSAY
jgi:hypothetical protein